MIERIVVLSSSNHITVLDLPAHLRAAQDINGAQTNPPPGEESSLQAAERQLIVETLRKFNWNRSKAARHLGVTRKALLYRIAKHGIEKQVPDPSNAECSPFSG